MLKKYSAPASFFEKALSVRVTDRTVRHDEVYFKGFKGMVDLHLLQLDDTYFLFCNLYDNVNFNDFNFIDIIFDNERDALTWYEIIRSHDIGKKVS